VLVPLNVVEELEVVVARNAKDVFHAALLEALDEVLSELDGHGGLVGCERSKKSKKEGETVSVKIYIEALPGTVRISTKHRQGIGQRTTWTMGKGVVRHHWERFVPGQRKGPGEAGSRMRNQSGP
jgi:hypothetical protein